MEGFKGEREEFTQNPSWEDAFGGKEVRDRVTRIFSDSFEFSKILNNNVHNLEVLYVNYSKKQIKITRNAETSQVSRKLIPLLL